MKLLKKRSNLSQLLDYAGSYKILAYLSWGLSAVGALLALVPFWYIWCILREVIETAPHYENAVHVTHYGWMATIAGLLTLLLIFDWRLGLLSLVPVALAFAVMTSMTGKEMQDKMTQYQNALADMSNEAVEYVRGIPVVKTFGQTVFSFKKFKGTIDNYERWVIAYTKQLRWPMTFYTLAVNSVFVFLIAGGFLFSRGGTDGGVLLNLLFYIIITPVISVTMTNLMFMSENGMIVQDAITRIDRVLQSPALSQPEVPQHPKDSSVTLNHVTRAGFARAAAASGRHLRPHGAAPDREAKLDAHEGVILFADKIRIPILSVEVPDQLRQFFFCDPSANFIAGRQLCRIFFRSLDRKGKIRANDEKLTTLFLLFDQLQLRVVHQVAIFQRLYEIRVFPVFHADQGQYPVFLFPIALRLRQNDHIFCVADAFEIGDGNGIGYAAVQQFYAIDLHDL